MIFAWFSTILMWFLWFFFIYVLCSDVFFPFSSISGFFENFLLIKMKNITLLYVSKKNPYIANEIITIMSESRILLITHFLNITWKWMNYIFYHDNLNWIVIFIIISFIPNLFFFFWLVLSFLPLFYILFLMMIKLNLFNVLKIPKFF